ncbi:MAG: hypothetical protein MPW15_10640 [Candidatus Manganitrophus sp.]|nr:hypothetical protein [Candidatus Manganitrophus sp.]
MKQRVMIAMALACEPELLIADEPTTALDVTIQAQILDLLRRLQRERGMAMLLITHDLAVVAEMADRVAVMYAGQIVETADRAAFFSNPRHPYSQKLFHSLPEPEQTGREPRRHSRQRAAAEPGIRRLPLRQPVRCGVGGMREDRSSLDCGSRERRPMPSLRPGRRGNTTRHLDRDSRFTRCSSNSKNTGSNERLSFTGHRSESSLPHSQRAL